MTNTRMGTGPGGKHENMRTYTPEECQMVMKLVEDHLPRWTLIAKLVSEKTGQERTAASVRNYYKRFKASKAIAEKSSSVTESGIKKLNRCQLCGQIKRGHICKPSALTYGVPQSSTASPGQPDASLFAGGPPSAFASADAGLQLASAAPAERLLALTGALPPLAAAALEAFDTPGTSPLSTLSGGLSGPFSVSGFTQALGSPIVASPMLVGPAPTVYAIEPMMGEEEAEPGEEDLPVATSYVPVCEIMAAEERRVAHDLSGEAAHITVQPAA